MAPDRTTDTPFHDLAAFGALPRVSGLTLSPDGSRLVVGVATLKADGRGRSTALWEVDPAGVAPARRLTWSADGESAAAFASDGSLLLTSTRPVPAGALPANAPTDAGAGHDSGGDTGTAPAMPDPDPPPRAALWQLPVSGEARPLADRPGGITGVLTARDAPVFAVTSPTLAGATDAADDARRRAARRTAGVSAILHSAYPVRYWDSDLGPDGPRLLSCGLPGADADGLPGANANGLPGANGDGLPGANGDGDAAPTPRDLTPDAGVHALREAAGSLSPDGSTLVTSWRVPEAHGTGRTVLVALDIATGGAGPCSTAVLPARPTSWTTRDPRSPRTAGGSPPRGSPGPPRPSRSTPASSWWTSPDRPSRCTRPRTGTAGRVPSPGRRTPRHCS